MSLEGTTTCYTHLYPNSPVLMIKQTIGIESSLLQPHAKQFVVQLAVFSQHVHKWIFITTLPESHCFKWGVLSNTCSYKLETT